MTDQPEKLDLRSLDLTEEKRQELLRLFPEIRTEGGKIDFERLKLALGAMVDVGKERYGMNWPGKAECFRTIQAPSAATLLPCPEESVNFDTTENLIIEGDNLEVLKLLQKSYLGKVKMIYIDPPYNTGNDFIYPDNYTESLQTYLEYTGQVDNDGRKFGTNNDTDGRFHSRWMNMIYPRLYLARNLLRDDGVIYISIDDNEVKNLRIIADEIFGEINFVASVIWEKKFSPQNDAKWFSDNHDYILVYAKNKEIWRPNPIKRNAVDPRYSNPDNDPRGVWASSDMTVKTYSEKYDYPIKTPRGEIIHPTNGRCWSMPKERFDELVKDNRVWFGKGGSNVPRYKTFLSEVSEGLVPLTIWKYQDVGHNQEARQELKELFSDEALFDSPKPVRLIRRMLDLSTTENEGDIVLDFFAGSGTLAEAILTNNDLDNGNRKFVLVQLPEPTVTKNFKVISDITKERVRRVIKKLNGAEMGQLPIGEPQDRGFRVFKLAESNFKPWNAQLLQNATALAKQLELHIEHIREERSPDDILYEILLKSGFPLTTPVETLILASKQVFSVAGGALLICLEPELTMEVIRAMAAQKPERVVCLDAGFAGNDQLKANAVQIFKTQGIPSFKTV